MQRERTLSDSIANTIRSMITIEKRFAPGDKLPNENDLSEELGVSRTTLREAIRSLAAGGVVEIQRGKGTFVRKEFAEQPLEALQPLSTLKVKADDLFEMRLIFEPEAAYYATLRATESELRRILTLGGAIEQQIQNGQDRTAKEQAFHRAIAKATHNEFMNQLMPILQEAIDKGVILSLNKNMALEDTVADHRMLMEFMRSRNAEGARAAMRIHILHAIEQLELKK